TFLCHGVGRTHLDFDALGSWFTDEQIVFGAHVLDEVFVHFVACHANRAADDDAAEGEDGDFSRAAADVDDHAAARFLHRKPRADGGGDRFFDQVDFTSACADGGIVDGAFFNF